MHYYNLNERSFLLDEPGSDLRLVFERRTVQIREWKIVSSHIFHTFHTCIQGVEKLLSTRKSVSLLYSSMVTDLIFLCERHYNN